MSYMEENLDMQLGDVLNIMQNCIVKHTTYFGIHTTKSPMDMWVYKEIIFKQKPDIIIEIGTGQGGATLALAHTQDIINHGKIISIDIDLSRVSDITKNHSRISLIEGDACAIYQHVLDKITSYANWSCPTEQIMIIEDSSHLYENTLNILRTYCGLVKKGDYFIIEDTNAKYGISGRHRQSSWEAVETFSKDNNDFEIDRTKESFFITWNPKGYLRRK